MRVLDLMLGLAAGAAVFFGVANAFIAFGRNGLLEFSVYAAAAVVVAILVASRSRYPVLARWGTGFAAALLVASAVAVGINRFQLARWPQGCRDVLNFPLPSSGTPACAPPNLADVPLPWLGPLLGLAGAVGIVTWLSFRRGRSGVPA